ncbi:MAG: hypothetical protein COV45_06090 [Deltaproteobacteria bacterium CG11_big_fil_rev_8_21_14_0_20_47_16]|nr:MAG: hypothetical protein COV45_06090 [Deltaproteobacteria bacterium CG11_big_fil_rev_8_21_14_0_20_47_16]
MTTFKNIILLGRPASGKSEFIDFLKRRSEFERKDAYHVGKIYELDDFLWLWEKFVEDDIWERSGHKRRYSISNGHDYTITDYTLLDFCLARFNVEHPKQPQDGTIFIEFARGKQDGGYRHALSRLSNEILNNSVVVFIYTSYEEACRRNEARYQEKLKHSVLAHKVPEADMVRFAKEIDWLELTDSKPLGRLRVRDIELPFVTIQNEPELTDAVALGERYGSALNELHKLLKDNN